LKNPEGQVLILEFFYHFPKEIKNIQSIYFKVLIGLSGK